MDWKCYLPSAVKGGTTICKFNKNWFLYDYQGELYLLHRACFISEAGENFQYSTTLAYLNSQNGILMNPWYCGPCGSCFVKPSFHTVKKILKYAKLLCDEKT